MNKPNTTPTGHPLPGRGHEQVRLNYNPDNVLDAEQVTHIRDKAREHGPGLMRVFMSEVMALTDTIRAQAAELEEARANGNKLRILYWHLLGTKIRYEEQAVKLGALLDGLWEAHDFFLPDGEEPQPTVAQATAPETEGGREGE